MIRGVAKQTASEAEQCLCFTMNMSKWGEYYNLYKTGAQFRRDRDELLNGGFIEIVENGKTTRTKNIYKFSDRWKGKPP